VRSTITKICNTVNEVLEQEVPDKLKSKMLQARLENSRKQLTQLNEDMKEALIQDEGAKEDLLEETKVVDEYEHQIELAFVMLSNALRSSSRPVSPTLSEHGTASSAGGSKKTYKLPKIQIKKFDGDILQWIGWWAQFEKIHEDEDLHPSDKFQYLAQSIVPNSKAKALIDRYPQSGENYPMAIETLKQRFGNPKILRKVYIRELQNLVISNVQKRVKLSDMYDTLDAHLRALKSLGACTDPSEFLYPMVESSLLEETLIAWQRSSFYQTGSSEDNKSELESLMKFLSLEMEAEQQRVLAKTGYQEKSSSLSKSKHPTRKDRSRQEDIPTAASLFSSEVSCIFCGNKHQSHDCLKARSLPMSERVAAVRGSHCCYTCLKKGHRANQCKSLVQCFICKKKHHTLMCYGEKEKTKVEPKNQTEGVQRNNEMTETKSSEVSSTYSNSSSRNTILLQTLRFRVYGSNQRSKEVRLVLDGGSQRSYIKAVLAEDLKCNIGESFTQQNMLFGGYVTEPKLKKSYQVTVGNVQSRFQKKLTLVGEKVVCISCPTVPNGPWIQELRRNGI